PAPLAPPLPPPPPPPRWLPPDSPWPVPPLPPLKVPRLPVEADACPPIPLENEGAALPPTASTFWPPSPVKRLVPPAVPGEPGLASAPTVSVYVMPAVTATMPLADAPPPPPPPA